MPFLKGLIKRRHSFDRENTNMRNHDESWRRGKGDGRGGEKIEKLTNFDRRILWDFT